MTHIVYLIKHLDTDKKYVGITSADLKTRWDQHRNDPNSAVYEALRADGHRMVMEVLEECDTREQALRREQELIHELGTAAPRGWNRKINTRNMQDSGVKCILPNPYKKKWRKLNGDEPNRLKLFNGLSLTEYRTSDFNFDNFAPLDCFIQFAAKRISSDDIEYELFQYVIVYNTVDIVHYGGIPDFKHQVEYCPYVWTDNGWKAHRIRRTPYTIYQALKNPWKLIFHYASDNGYKMCDLYDYERKTFISDEEIYACPYTEVYP